MEGGYLTKYKLYFRFIRCSRPTDRKLVKRVTDMFLKSRTYKNEPVTKICNGLWENAGRQIWKIRRSPDSRINMKNK